MAVQVVNKTIDGKKYTVTSFLAGEGLKIKSVLIKHLGPMAISGVILGGSSGKKLSEMDIDPAMVGTLFDTLFNKLDPDEFAGFVLRLLACTSINNTQDVPIPIDEQIFNTEFAGEYATLYKVLFFVLEVNYKKSFLGWGGLGALTEKLKAMTGTLKNLKKKGNDSGSN